MEITIKVNTSQDIAALEKLVQALKASTETAVTAAQEPVNPTPVFMNPVPGAVTNPGPAVNTGSAPWTNQPFTAPVETLPTTTPGYTIEDLAKAASLLAGAGKRDQILALMNSFGVGMLTELPKEHFGAFAVKLRELGAKI
ncbi:hypothetical protein EDC14_10163 [Hydrogenispora ethanolica]|uniref:Uncharacterized protein n=1 Tax=Hydrogenispora ethanolica TaxID=1082276 RepID=A0A4R1RIF8_HYDET|nr:hypothetical protein [Hydrogenispora ethanolica]TCL65874.1 hypothetical protein EDC14_10163 [Hydrogenispora ethanolica]